MRDEELLGYLYGLRLELRHRGEYYTNMAKKWEGRLEDKIEKFTKAYGWLCEERLVMELLNQIEGG